uniref:Hyaluronidase n=1 Tax=Haemonchus contortus TaxID=6289 RepID=A0A7I4Y8J8_HAECO
MNYSGDKVALFYEFTFGRYPYYNKSVLSAPINYGIPLNVTNHTGAMEQHLNISAYNITSTILGVNYSTLAVIDFEEWRPLYEQNTGSKRVYQNASELLERKAHPNFTDEQIREVAKTDYNETAKDFILKTLIEARQLRPNASWGMYGFPYCNYDAGKNEGEYDCNQTYQKYNDRMMYIYENSTALFPSIYLGFNATSEHRFRYVQAILKEALRISRKFPKRLPIYAYTKFEYDPLKKNCSFYDDYDLCTTLKLPALMGIDGLIFWSSSANMMFRCTAIMDFVKYKLGPRILNFNDTCGSFSFPVTNITEYGGLCNVTITNPFNPTPSPPSQI